MTRNFVRDVLAAAVLCAGMGGAAAWADEPPPAPPPTPAPAPDAPPPAPPPTPEPAPIPPPVPDAGAPKTDAPPPAAPAPLPSDGKETPKDDATPKPDEKKQDEAKKDEPKKEEPKKEEGKKEEPPKETPPPPPAVETVPTCMPCEPMCVHGTVSVRYRLRTNGDDHDSDLYEYLTLRLRDEDQPGWSASLHARLAEDLDGKGAGEPFFVFDSVDDTYDSSVTARLYHAYANYRPCGGAFEEIRIGRQYVDAGEGFLVDGVRATTSPVGGRHEVRFTGFVGLPAHLYEGSLEGDFICGLGVGWKPWRGADARVDWAHVEDKNEFYGFPVNDVFTAEIRQQVGSCTHARLWYQQVDDQPRILAGSFDTYSPWSDVTVRGAFRTQLGREKALVFDIDPYYAIAQTLEPYWDGRLAVSKGFGECFVAEGGADVRRLWNGDDEGTFNREFERLYATLSTWHWPSPCLSLSVTGEWWHSHDEVTTVGFEAEWKPNRVWRAVLGTDYALYRTDLYTASERLDSRGWYLRASYAPCERWRADVSLRIEDDSYDTYATLQAGVRFEF